MALLQDVDDSVKHALMLKEAEKLKAEKEQKQAEEQQKIDAERERERKEEGFI